jgi:hypothetical protein
MNQEKVEAHLAKEALDTVLIVRPIQIQAVTITILIIISLIQLPLNLFLASESQCM